MKTTCIAMIAVMYVLPMLIVSSYGSDSSSDEYQWIDYTSELVSERKSLLVHDDEDSWKGVGHPWVVARVTYDNGDKFPCMAQIEFENEMMVKARCSDSYRSYPLFKAFDVLQTEPNNAIWIKSSNGNVEDGAIEGGNIGGETIYVCRAHYEKYETKVRIGMMRPSDGFCVFQNSRQDNYDLLVYAGDGEIMIY